MAHGLFHGPRGLQAATYARARSHTWKNDADAAPHAARDVRQEVLADDAAARDVQPMELTEGGAGSGLGPAANTAIEPDLRRGIAVGESRGAADQSDAPRSGRQRGDEEPVLSRHVRAVWRERIRRFHPSVLQSVEP